MPSMSGESGCRWQDGGDGGAAGLQGAVAKSVADEPLGGFGFEVFLVDDGVKLLLTSGGDEPLPFLVDRVGQGYRVDEGLDQVLLVAQCGAGIHRPADLGADLPVLAVAVLLPVSLDEHEDVVDVDLDLLDELDLEGHVIVDAFLVPVPGLPELGVQVEVHAAVVLAVAFREDLVSRVLVEGAEDVLQPQDRAEQGDERLLLALAHDPLADRIRTDQLMNFLRILLVVVVVRFEQHDALGVLVAEQLQRLVGLFLQVAEGDDVAVRLDRVEDPVRPAERLDQAMQSQVLVHEQRVQRGRVEAGEEHVDHDHQVDLPVLQAQ